MDAGIVAAGSWAAGGGSHPASFRPTRDFRPSDLKGTLEGWAAWALSCVFVNDQQHEMMAQLFFSYGVCLRPNRFIVVALKEDKYVLVICTVCDNDIM